MPVLGSAPRGEVVDRASRWLACWALLAISASTTSLSLSRALSLSPSLTLLRWRTRDAGVKMYLEEGDLLGQASEGGGG